MAEPKMVRVQTGPSSFIEFNEADAKEWRKRNTEYGAADAPADDAEQEQPAEGKVVSGPAENKAENAPAEKKAR